MEAGGQAADYDSDETVIDGSVTESDPEEEELPWRRLLFDQDTSLRSEYSLHPDRSGMCKGTSPEIQLGFKLRENPREQKSKNKIMPLSDTALLQQPQDEMEQNQTLFQNRKSFPLFTVSFSQAKLPLNHQSIQGPEAENSEILPNPEKELSTDSNSPEISFLSGTATKVSDVMVVKEKSLVEPKEILAVPNKFSESGKEALLTMNSEETQDEESSLKTFVSALEKLLTSPEIPQEERLFEIMSDFESKELTNPLSNSPSSTSVSLTCHRDLLENPKDDGLPAELLAALNTLSEGNVEPICHREEGGSSLSAGNEYSGGEPKMSQTSEDCTQITEVNSESLCSAPLFEQDSKVGELQDKHLSPQHVNSSILGDPNPFGLQTLVHQNVPSCDPLNNKGNSNSVENKSDQDIPRVLRRSSRLKGRDAKHIDDVYKMPEKILPKILVCEDQTTNNSSTKNFRMQDPALKIQGKGKNMYSTRLKNREQIRRNQNLAGKKEKVKMDKISLSRINRRNIFGENLLYQAALHNDVDLIHRYITKGGNVNQPSYAGWTALHEASVGGFYQAASELLKGGAHVNIKGMYQITPLHDAVINGHYKVAELLLLNGADPLLKSDNGKCALDEAKDSCMKRLLEKYVPKYQKHYLTSDEELTSNINGDESTMRNGEKEEKTDSEIHMSNIQECKKVQNFRKRQNLLKATRSQEMKTAGINKRRARGESRLHLAARRGTLSLVKAPIESGADVNLKDNAGWTPLHKASTKRSNDKIVELLKAGANVNCEKLGGILPLHDAVANNHLKAAEILLPHGANPNQKNQKQKTALDEADNEKMKELLISFGAIETDNRNESNATVTVKIPAVQPKRHKWCFCDDCNTVDPPSLSQREKRRESYPVHQAISAILQNIEEKQGNLLEFEIRTPEDAEQCIEKMLEIKEIMDYVLAKQKAERDDLAKKYRVSIESFKQGVLREQLANLATRQKSLLVVAKKQKKITEKIQNYKNITSLSGPSLRKPPSSSEISSEKDSQDLISLENSLQPQSGSLSLVSLTCGSMQETPLSPETWNSSPNTNTCVNSETVRREFSGNELISKQNVNDGTFDGSPKSRCADGTKIKLPSQPVALTAQREYSQRGNDLTEPPAPEREPCNHPSAVTNTLNIAATTSILARNDAHPSAVVCDQAPTSCDPKRGKRKIASQQPSRGTLESLTHQGTDVLGSNTGHQTKSYPKKPAFTVRRANDSHSSSPSERGRQHIIKKPVNSSTVPRKKCMQIKDLILLGRINPGKNILEFKTQETTHKASVLLSGKIKVENGQIYQNPVTWLKDLLGGNSYVTWNYAWSKVTYLGKELLQYVSEEVPVSAEPNVVLQQHQPCLLGTSRESMQSIPPYLQINEVLLISDQEFLPCHIMDQHWKFYVECEELTF
ncbi:ankyrin repeat domain-containing protein 31 isoform X6 [Canis lupus familiaris]|uniref:ankyrin repeat domain-containing protein 31 isoform X6 n=1 Tax=Canis lupus dingo TaxID=286419 RepID=UPI000BAA1760|nr:ankyrin repeat domain-containing protein 31 isoform X6 [Canis lupus dingo]XP_038388476.1 ankyrin repeat domain-containing protein 31 isoform X6 [Canis lupus familiaris]XP_038516973.1 ankyrin repeat domain-containing protein 31 isoform X6 [Canis lupus familiaris]|eukprot:XP_022272503.1 putative ankyrin repeat domain-containing protein 31 isoform X5 [Canis lupus familiaris]